MEDGWTDSKVVIHLPTMEFFFIEVVRNAAHCGRRNVGSDGRTVGRRDGGSPSSSLHCWQLRGSFGVCHGSLFLNRQTRGRQFGRRWNWQSLLASATTIHDANRHLFVGAVTFFNGISLLVLAQIVARCRSCCLQRWCPLCLKKNKQLHFLYFSPSFLTEIGQSWMERSDPGNGGKHRLLERGRRDRSCQKTLILGAAQTVLRNGEATAHYVGYEMHSQPIWVRPGIHTRQNQQGQDHSTTLTSPGGRSKQPSLFLAGYIIAKMWN
jgi:hypothetical protein